MKGGLFNRPPEQVVKPCNGWNRMTVEKFDKLPVKVCKCGTVVSKYNTRRWCRACQRKGRDTDERGED